MKKITFIILALTGLLFISCNNNSITQEEWTKLKENIDEQNNSSDNTVKINSKGNILSCNNIYLTLNGNTINNSEFIFGEKFQINFDNITGFNLIDGKFYPSLSIIILDKNNDTIFVTDDLYGNNGFKTAQISLNAYLECADPMYSNNTYHAFINIWDKKGEGTFASDFEFSVKPTDKITTETNKLSYKEVYLYSKDSKKVIFDNKVNLYERVYIIFEGLDGFVVSDSLASVGMDLLATDINGDTVIYIPDFFPEPIKAFDLFQASSVKLVFKDKKIKDPLNCNVFIWDKKSDANINAKFKLNLIR